MCASNIGIYIGISAEKEYAETYDLESRKINLSIDPCSVGIAVRSGDESSKLVGNLANLIKRHAKSDAKLADGGLSK